MAHDPISFMEFYQQSLRTPLFTGFLTLSGFLFSAKAFLITNLIKEVYATDYYRNRVHELRKYNDRLTVTGPLKTLASYLQVSIFMSLAASLSQMTIGMIQHNLAVCFCLTIATIAAALVVYAIWLLRQNINDWIETIEEKSKDADRPAA